MWYRKKDGLLTESSTGASSVVRKRWVPYGRPTASGTAKGLSRRRQLGKLPEKDDDFLEQSCLPHGVACR